MKFKFGDKVICINANKLLSNSEFYDNEELILEKEYTIRDHGKLDGQYICNLGEVFGRFRQERFKLVKEKIDPKYNNFLSALESISTNEEKSNG